MNILLITPHFYPENFKINDLAIELIKKNHKVSVITSIPNYPDGKFRKGYGYFSQRYEVFNNIKIYRCFVIPRGRGNRFMMFLNYFSYVIGAIIKSFSILNNKFDIIFVFETSPITVCIPAIFIKFFKKIPICMWVLDLWPESVKYGAKFKSDLIIRLLKPMVKFIYKNTDKVIVSSKGFIQTIQNDYGIKDIEYIPQWSEDIYFPKKDNDSIIDQLFNVEDFNIIFAGNIGEPQNLINVAKAAIILKKYQKIKFYIVGDGRKKNELQYFANQNNLVNFIFFDRYPIEKMPFIFKNADALLISLKDNKIFSKTIPAKLQTYLISGKPILTLASGEINNIVLESKSGLISHSDDFKNLSKNILKLQNMDHLEIKKISHNAINYYNKNFDRDLNINKIVEILKNTCYK